MRLKSPCPPVGGQLDTRSGGKLANLLRGCLAGITVGLSEIDCALTIVFPAARFYAARDKTAVR